MNDKNIILQNKGSDFSSSYINIVRNELEDLKQLVELFKDSHYNQAFLYETTELNEQQQSVKVLKANTNDMLSTMITGRMIGLNPLEALALGKSLDQHAISKVAKGRTLGLDVHQSLNLIHAFTNPKDGKSSLMVSANLIESILLKNDIKIEILKNCENVIKYYAVPDLSEIPEKVILNSDGLVKEEYVQFNQQYHTTPILSKLIGEGKKFYTAKVVDQITTVRCTRLKRNKLDIKEYSVTLQDCIDWGFVKGTTREGTVIEKSRSMWAARRTQMMSKTALSNCGRRIANDLLEGLYSYEEMGIDIPDTIEEVPIVDIDVVEETTKD